MPSASGYASRPLAQDSLEDSAPERNSLARAFSRWGWIGFWAQVTIGTIPVLLIIYAFLSGRINIAGTRSGLAVVQYLTVAGLLLLAFTTFWSYRYTRLGKRFADPEHRLPVSLLQRAAWTGVAASALGVSFSILVMLFEVAQLLFYFLRAPQAGVPAIQTTASGAPSWVSAADVMTILALNTSLLVEFVVLALSLWLLFRSTLASELSDFASEH
jgi:heme/copper-type cytochrome/quinol oxidase subunit 4